MHCSRRDHGVLHADGHEGPALPLVAPPARRGLRHVRAFGLRVVSPDRPGIGLSDRAKERRTVDWAQDVTELVDQLGVALATAAQGP
mgnify:CR=1 FL=1